VAKSDEELKDVERQWDEFQATFVAPEALTDDELKKAVTEDLKTVSAMTVEEYTLYQKWLEIHIKYPTHTESTLWGPEVQLDDLDQGDEITRIKNNIWIPDSPEDYLKLQPELIYTPEFEMQDKWNSIRNFTSTMKNNSNIGRNLSYIVVDSVTKNYLGVICISSDFLDLTPRDNYIGWNRDVKTNQGMINHTAIGSTIVPLQPLGFNYLGGKLLALLCLTDKVQHDWKKQYNDILVGVTTTSLYGQNKAGGLSQYDNLKHWKKMGYTSGSVSYETRKPTVALMLDWLKANHTRKYFEWYIAKNLDGMPYKRDHKNRSYSFIYSQLGIEKDLIRSEHARGIYFSPLYTNTNEFLRKEITEKELAKAFDTSYDALVGIWKEKYVARRVKSLIENDRFTKETLFYDDLIYMDWEETKSKYLSQVGR
jgi:hypothetical protein